MTNEKFKHPGPHSSLTTDWSPLEAHRPLQELAIPSAPGARSGARPPWSPIFALLHLLLSKGFLSAHFLRPQPREACPGGAVREGKAWMFAPSDSYSPKCPTELSSGGSQSEDLVHVSCWCPLAPSKQTLVLLIVLTFLNKGAFAAASSLQPGVHFKAVFLLLTTDSER